MREHVHVVGLDDEVVHRGRGGRAAQHAPAHARAAVGLVAVPVDALAAGAELAAAEDDEDDGIC